jgi:hypothetical protein
MQYCEAFSYGKPKPISIQPTGLYNLVPLSRSRVVLQFRYSLLLARCILILLSTPIMGQTMKPLTKTVNAFGIELKVLKKQARKEYESRIVRNRDELLPDSARGITSLYELQDGSILEILLPDFPKESKLRLFNSESDYLQMWRVAFDQSSEQKQYEGKSDFQIIALNASEIPEFQESHLHILAEEARVAPQMLDYSQASVNHLNSAFMRVMKPWERSNSRLIKSFLFYIAECLHRITPGSYLHFDQDSSLVNNVRVVDGANRSFNAHLNIFEIWTEGPWVTTENDAGKRERKRLTLEMLFLLELGKYEHRFKAKTGN